MQCCHEGQFSLLSSWMFSLSCAPPQCPAEEVLFVLLVLVWWAAIQMFNELTPVPRRRVNGCQRLLIKKWNSTVTLVVWCERLLLLWLVFFPLRFKYVIKFWMVWMRFAFKPVWKLFYYIVECCGPYWKPSSFLGMNLQSWWYVSTFQSNLMRKSSPSSTALCL